MSILKGDYERAKHCQNVPLAAVFIDDFGGGGRWGTGRGGGGGGGIALRYFSFANTFKSACISIDA